MRTAIASVVFLFAASLAAQPLTIGTQIVEEGHNAIINTGAPNTYVNLGSRATATGTVDTATVAWSGSCSNAFKIIFLRPSFALSQFTVVATRGPFDAVAGRNQVSLSPPVDIREGDVIGVVQLQPLAACGSVRVQSSGNTHLGYELITSGDMSTNSGTIGVASNYTGGYEIGVIAFNSNPLLVRVLPAAGAAPGATAFFRTSLQMLNPTSTRIKGSVVFHKQLQSAGPGDPSLAFVLGPGQSVSYPDIVASMGTSGIGSLDIVTEGGNAPIVTARVFSDGGPSGTSGFSEEALAPNDALDFVSHGILLIPPDLTNFRMNVGIRTLDAGATLSVTTYDSIGNLVATRPSVTYAPNVFDQAPVATFTGASPVPPGGYILITVTTFPGRAFLYSSVIDNKTSDSTYRLADIK